MSELTANRTKLLFITPFTLPETAGSGINAFRFAKYLNRAGDMATLLSLNRNLRLRYKDTIENVPVLRIPYLNKGIILKICSLPIILIYYLLKISRNDIILIYGGKTIAFQAAIILSKIMRKHIVFQSVLIGVDDPETLILKKHTLLRILNHYVLSKVDCYFAINNDFASQYVKLVKKKEKIFSCAQGVDTNIFRTVSTIEKGHLREKLYLPCNTFLIVSAGFLIHRKGYPEIFKQLASLSIDFTYLILGDTYAGNHHFMRNYDKEMRQVHDSAVQLLKERFIYTGFRNNIDEYLKCADVFLMNSAQEGLPNVLLEAMACGVPVIVRSMKGVDQFLTFHNTNALVFTRADEIPTFVEQLYKDSILSKQLASNAHQFIQENYSFERVYQELKKKLSRENLQ